MRITFEIDETAGQILKVRKHSTARTWAEFFLVSVISQIRHQTRCPFLRGDQAVRVGRLGRLDIEHLRTLRRELSVSVTK